MMGGILDQLSGKVIAVVGVALVATLLVSVLSMTKSANIPQELLYMSMRIQQMYYGAPDYSGLDTATAIKAGVVPKNLIKGSTIKHDFNGDITLAPGSDNETFTFTLTNIPKDECATLANNKMNSWISVSVNGTTASDVAAVVAACSDKSTLIFEAQ